MNATSQPERVDKYADSRSQIEKLMSGATSEKASEVEEGEITDSASLIFLSACVSSAVFSWL